MKKNLKILVYGYGNPGRQDDGLGVKLVEMIEDWAEKENIENIECDSNYQLNIEDAFNISDKDYVFFVDASTEDIKDYMLEKVIPSPKVEFTMHSTSPSFILDLCHKMYNKYPETYLMHIKGYEWEFMNEITEKATINLKNAFTFLQKKISGIIS